MVSVQTFRKIALSFPNTEELPHFHLSSFRVRKKIFATLCVEEKRAMLKLSPQLQSVYCTYDPNVFFPVPGTWGKQGATYTDLKRISPTLCKETLSIAYQELLKKMGSLKRE